MISRRNIRVKVMQLLYMKDSSLDNTAMKSPTVELNKSFNQTKELLVYLLYFVGEVAKYAETDALRKSNKYLPTDDDLNVNTKLSGNQLLVQMREDEGYLKAVETIKPQRFLNDDILKRVYNNLVATDQYQVYTFSINRDKEKEREVLRLVFNSLMLPDDVFVSHIEELFSNWDDDCEMIEQLVNSYLFKPNSININEIITPDKFEFAVSLLKTTWEKKDYLLNIIKPKLQNWDADRIATLDMILMQMGVAEFLYFETIPTKVTINEYIDIAKEYSTEQSGHFVNGILDGIHKELAADGKLNKIDFKQKR